GGGLRVAQRAPRVRVRAGRRARAAVALDDVVALPVALQVLEHVLEAGLVRVGVGMAGDGAGSEVALPRDDGVGEGRRARERLEVRRPAALRRPAGPGPLLRRVPEAVLDVPAHDTLLLLLGEGPDADVRPVRRRVEEAD